MQKSRVKKALIKPRMAEFVHMIVLFFPYLVGKLSRGRYFTKYFWKFKEMRMTYENPQKFWTEWGRYYIYDKSRNKPHEEHEFFVRKVVELRPRKILEVGCGFGLNLKLIARAYNAEELVGVDFSPTMLRNAESYLKGIPATLIEADVCHGLPFEDSQFDLVFTHGLLMHIKPQKIEKVLRELVRVTKKHIINMEVAVPIGTGLEYVEMGKGRYSYNYAQKYRNLGLEVVLDQRIGHWITVARKK